MFKHLKRIKKINKSVAVREANEIDYDEEGRAQINVGLKTAEDFFSPFSYKTYEFMNPEVSNYINMCEASIPVKDDLSIDIYTEEPTDNEEKKRIRRAVKRYHAEQLVIVNKKLKRNFIQGLIFSVLGILILLAEAIIYNVVENMYLDTLLAVIGWLFLWDGVEVWLDDRAELKRKKVRSYRILNAKIHVRKYSRKIQREYGFGEFEEEDDDE